MENNELTKNIFCAKEQTIMPYRGRIDGNGEFLFECTGCDRFIKLPAETTKEQLETFIEAHQQANEGQVSIEEQEERLSKMLGEPVAPQE